MKIGILGSGRMGDCPISSRASAMTILATGLEPASVKRMEGTSMTSPELVRDFFVPSLRTCHTKSSCCWCSGSDEKRNAAGVPLNPDAVCDRN